MSATPASTPKIPAMWVGKDDDGIWTVAMRDSIGWVTAGTGEPLPDPETLGWTRLTPQPPTPNDGHCRACGRPFPAPVRGLFTADDEQLPPIELDHPTLGRIRWDWDRCAWVAVGAVSSVSTEKETRES